MARRLALAVLALLAAGPVRGAADAATRRGRAREVLKSQRCDACHDSAVSTENQRALSVYDLVQPAWPARMTDAQLPKLLTRLKSAPAADQKAVRDFIAAELKARAAGPR
jgi:hypothetical protein